MMNEDDLKISSTIQSWLQSQGGIEREKPKRKCRRSSTGSRRQPDRSAGVRKPTGTTVRGSDRTRRHSVDSIAFPQTIDEEARVSRTSNNGVAVELPTHWVRPGDYHSDSDSSLHHERSILNNSAVSKRDLEHLFGGGLGRIDSGAALVDIGYSGQSSSALKGCNDVKDIEDGSVISRRSGGGAKSVDGSCSSKENSIDEDHSVSNSKSFTGDQTFQGIIFRALGLVAHSTEQNVPRENAEKAFVGDSSNDVVKKRGACGRRRLHKLVWRGIAILTFMGFMIMTTTDAGDALLENIILLFIHLKNAISVLLGP